MSVIYRCSFISPGLSLVSTDTVRRYHYVDTEYSWLEAQTHCREKFVDLATVKDRGDNDRLLKALQGRQGYAWIGLQDDLTKWTWTNMSFSDEKYSNWESEDDDDESNVNLSRDKCILMKTSGIWVEETCGKELFSVCYDGKRGVYFKIRLKRRKISGKVYPTWTLSRL